MWLVGFCSLWDSVPWLGIEPRALAVRPRNPNHWLTREFQIVQSDLPKPPSPTFCSLPNLSHFPSHPTLELVFSSASSNLQVSHKPFSLPTTSSPLPSPSTHTSPPNCDSPFPDPPSSLHPHYARWGACRALPYLSLLHTYRCKWSLS